MKTNHNILIIGGGAAGLMAAIAASRHGASVGICEKNPRVGRKILATGNGRCNLSNAKEDASCYFGANRKFAPAILNQCGLNRTLVHFERMGLAYTTEKKTGRIFPMSFQASAVLDILRRTVYRQKVTEICETDIHKIKKSGKNWTLTSHDGRQLTCRKVIISTGGKAAPGMGSNGSGYALAEQLGHTVISPFPALAQIMISTPWMKSLKGIKTDAELCLIDSKRNIWETTGEIHFTDYGLSGLPALSMARHVNEILQKGGHPEIAVNLLFHQTPEASFEFLWDQISAVPQLTLEQALISIFHKRLIPVLIKTAGLNSQMICETLKAGQIRDFVSILRHWVLPVKATKSWTEAQVTAGGVNTQEVNEHTLESLKAPRVYFAGEVLDVDGDCGGYNLQWAWSSGWLAGYHAEQAIQKINTVT